MVKDETNLHNSFQKTKEDILQARRLEITKRFLCSDCFGVTSDNRRTWKKSFASQYKALSKGKSPKNPTDISRLITEKLETIDVQALVSHVKSEIHLIDAIQWLLLLPTFTELETYLKDEHTLGERHRKTKSKKARKELLDDEVLFISLERAAVVTHWLEACVYEKCPEPLLASYLPPPIREESIGSYWTKELIRCSLAQEIAFEILEAYPETIDLSVFLYTFDQLRSGLSQKEFSLPKRYMLNINREILEIEQHELVYQVDGETVTIGRLPNRQNWAINTDLLKKNGNLVENKPFYRKLHEFSKVKKSSRTFMDICCGVGGFRIAFQEQGYRCVFSSDINHKSKETYFRNYGVVPFDDITRYTEENGLSKSPRWEKEDFAPEDLLPDVFALTGGFPCQPFSRAGKQKGTKDSRGNLFFNICTIAKKKKIDTLVLENVRGITSVDEDNSGETLRNLKDELFACDYPNVHIYNVNAVDFGVPQKRIRLFFIATHQEFVQAKGTKKKKSTPVLGDVLISVKGLNEAFCLSQFLSFSHWHRAEKNKRNNKGFGFDVVDPKKSATVTLTTRYYKDSLECCVISRTQDWGYGTNKKAATTWKKLDGTFQTWFDTVKNPMTIKRDVFLESVGLSEETLKNLTSPLRSLSPRESARCFGFPDWFALSRSNNDAFFQFGNSIAVPIASRIACSIKDKKTNKTEKVLVFSGNLKKYFSETYLPLFDEESLEQQQVGCFP